MARRRVGSEIDIGPVPVHLSCDHELLFKPPYPKLRDTLWCKWCSKEVTVVTIADTYGMTCDQCPRLNRRYGTALYAARAAASKHVLKFPTHVCEIRKSGDFLERVTNDGTQGELPFAAILNKRATQVAASQALLRTMTEKTIDNGTTTGNVVDVKPAPVHQEEP